MLIYWSPKSYVIISRPRHPKTCFSHPPHAARLFRSQQVMAAQLKEIVDRLNAEPFNLDLSLLVFDEKEKGSIWKYGQYGICRMIGMIGMQKGSDGMMAERGAGVARRCFPLQDPLELMEILKKVRWPSSGRAWQLRTNWQSPLSISVFEATQLMEKSPRGSIAANQCGPLTNRNWQCMCVWE